MELYKFLHDGKQQNEETYIHTYLGTIFNYNGKFTVAIRKQIVQAKKALFSLLSKGRKLQLPNDILCHLFDTCITPILLYGSEIWGFSNITEIERVHLYFCKYILKVKSSTPNCMVLGELGRCEMSTLIKQRMLNFWHSIETGKTTKLSHQLLQSLKSQMNLDTFISPWLKSIEDTLVTHGLGNLYTDPFSISSHKFRTRVASSDLESTILYKLQDFQN